MDAILRICDQEWLILGDYIEDGFLYSDTYVSIINDYIEPFTLETRISRGKNMKMCAAKDVHGRVEWIK